MYQYYLGRVEVSPRGAVADVLDYDILISKFQLQSRHYVHFQNFLIVPLFLLQQGWLWHEIIHKV